MLLYQFLCTFEDGIANFALEALFSYWYTCRTSKLLLRLRETNSTLPRKCETWNFHNIKTLFFMIPAILGGLIAEIRSTLLCTSVPEDVPKVFYMHRKHDGRSVAFCRQIVVMEVAYEVDIIMEWRNTRQDAHLHLSLFLPFLYILICYLTPQYPDMLPLPC